MTSRGAALLGPASVDADTVGLARYLERVVEGEVRFDRVSRLLYSTDASIYQILPLGVVLPRSERDVIATVELARRHGVPVLPRGGGTSLAGQTVGPALVIDYSKYMRRLLEVDPERRAARVQPGIVLDELNRVLSQSGLMFAPDPSTANRGNVGGALGNNSCGAHSIVWGKTSDNVVSLRTVLSDGSVAELGQMDGPAIRAAAAGEGLLASAVKELLAVGDEYGREVAARYPDISRRVSGYNLDLLPGGGSGVLDLARFVVGSEGTLLNVTEATLRLVKRPTVRALAALHFEELIESMEAAALVLETEPAAVEHVGSMILRQARNNLHYSRLMDWVQGDPEAMLLVEFAGESEAEVVASLDRLERLMRRAGFGYAVTRLTDHTDQSRVWAVRRAGLGLMMNAPGPAKPLPFVEDTAVDPARLPDFVRRFDEIVREAGTEAGYYGHASVGCLHIRPMIDPKTEAGIEQMVSIADAISDLVLEFGGALSGEHGDGLVRSAYLEKMFGPSVVEAFARVKRAFDPAGIMNPGKIVDPPAMTENLRIDPSYRTAVGSSEISFEREGGLAAAIEMCNGQGACRKPTGGTMCPSFMVTRDEEHSTRGRANALRSAISGAVPLESMTGERVGRVMDLCLGCRACKAECPSNVDMAKLKFEVAARRRRAHGAGIREYILGNVDRLGALGSMFAPVSNWLLESPAAGPMAERLAGVDRRRRLPRYAGQTFRQWMRARSPGRRGQPVSGSVALFADTFTDYHHPEIGCAAVSALEALGRRVMVPDFRCCGRPQLTAGDVDRARTNAAHNVSVASRALEQGAALVGLEPSCALTFTEEYLDLLPGDGEVRMVADAMQLVDRYLAGALAAKGSWPRTAPSGPTLVHGHCHQKALVGTAATQDVLRALRGPNVEEVEAGCCGMAGSFGFETEHYEISMAIGELSLFPAIRDRKGEFEVVSMGVSCRQQIADGTGLRARHLVEVAAEVLACPEVGARRLAAAI